MDLYIYGNGINAITSWITKLPLIFWSAICDSLASSGKFLLYTGNLQALEASFNSGGVNGEFTKKIQDAINLSMNALTGSDLLKNVVFISTILSVFFVAMKYTIVIFKTYQNNIEGQQSAPTIDFFKRIFYVLIMFMVAPMIMFNGLYFATYTAMGAGNMILSQSDNKADEAYRKYWYYHQKTNNGISAMTWCESSNNEEFSNKKEYMAKKLAAEQSPNGIANDFISKKSEAWNVLCSTDSVYVVDYQAKNTNPNRLVMKNGLNGSEGYVMVYQWMWDSGVTNLTPIPPSGNTILALISYIANSIFTIAILVMTAMRVVDLISALLMMWYYGQAYVSEMRSNAVGEFIKKISSVWMTQFFTITMYSIYLASSASATAEPSLASVIMTIAILTVVIKGPKTIGDILSDSGTKGVLGSGASKLRGALGG